MTTWTRLAHVTMRVVSVLALVVWLTAGAQSQEFVGGTALTGIGGAYAGLPADPAVIWHNPALPILSGERGGGGLSYRHLFELSDLEEIVGSAYYRVHSQAALGVGISQFGTARLFEEFAGLVSAAVRLPGPLAVGSSLKYRRTEFGDGALVFSGASFALGAAWRPWPELLAAAAVRDITLDELHEVGNPETAWDVSVAWSVPPDLTIAGRWYKENGADSRFGVGQVLWLTPQVAFLSGLRFDPVRYALGGKVAHSGVTVHYVFESHADLGATHNIGFGWIR